MWWDRAANVITQPLTVIRDTTPPTITIDLPGVASLRFRVSWSGDDECGVRHYDVQYKAGAGGTWTGWLTATTRTEAVFLGQSNQTYYFRIRATDNVSNTSAWIESGPVSIQAVRKNYHFGDQLVATRRGDEVYFIHADHLGSTSLTTDNSGTLVAETRYLPYGEERWTAGGAQPTDFTFTGQRAERGFGLMDYQARYYGPRLGRFISPDSIVPNPGDPQDLNRYSYVRGNPIRFNDPSGHCWNPLTGSADQCIAAWQRTIDAYQTGERRLGVLALHSSGITDRLVKTSEKIDQLNADADVVFSNAPLEERLLPSVRLGVWATTIAAAIVGAGQLTKAAGAATTELANPVPNRMARVVSLRGGRELSDISMLGLPEEQNVFVTAADDIAGVTTSRGLAERLTLVDRSGTLIEGPYAVFEFDTPASGVASPAFRGSPGFKPGGLTAGGAREFTIPNSLLSDLQNLVVRILE
jgi:RHS repeat-associated protein